VKSIQQLPDDQADQQNNSNDMSYLLVDEQWQIREGRQSHYAYIVNKALNSSSVQEVSQISNDFDPDYQSLLLHRILIHRDDRVLDRIDRSQIDLIQREKDLEYQVYDGSKTLNVFIEDVRPGDSMEYSYTIQGSNPLFSRQFSEQLDMRRRVPVGRVHYRVLRPSSRPLRIRNHKPASNRSSGLPERTPGMSEMKTGSRRWSRKFGEFRFDAGDINWLMVIIVVQAFAGAGFLSYKYQLITSIPDWKGSKAG
jgi:hypothetical protein